MTRGLVAALIKQRRANAQLSEVHIDLALDCRAPQSTLRGTKLPTLVDKGGWARLYQLARNHKYLEGLEKFSQISTTSFSELGLSPNINKAVDQVGSTVPTAFQRSVIAHALERRDLLCIKERSDETTVSFALPIMSMLAQGNQSARTNRPRALVLCPTRELGTYVYDTIGSLSKHVPLTCATLLSGTSFEKQAAMIDKGVDILVSTPGRFLDHYERGRFNLLDVKVIVINDFDQMCDMGFKPEIERICTIAPSMPQKLIFSSSMTKDTQRFVRTYLTNPAIWEGGTTSASEQEVQITLEKRAVLDHNKASTRSPRASREAKNAGTPARAASDSSSDSIESDKITSGLK